MASSVFIFSHFNPKQIQPAPFSMEEKGQNATKNWKKNYYNLPGSVAFRWNCAFLPDKKGIQPPGPSHLHHTREFPWTNGIDYKSDSAPQSPFRMREIPTDKVSIYCKVREETVDNIFIRDGCGKLTLSCIVELGQRWCIKKANWLDRGNIVNALEKRKKRGKKTRQ